METSSLLRRNKKTSESKSNDERGTSSHGNGRATEGGREGRKEGRKEGRRSEGVMEVGLE